MHWTNVSTALKVVGRRVPPTTSFKSPSAPCGSRGRQPVAVDIGPTNTPLGAHFHVKIISRRIGQDRVSVPRFRRHGPLDRFRRQLWAWVFCGDVACPSLCSKGLDVCRNHLAIRYDTKRLSWPSHKLAAKRRVKIRRNLYPICLQAPQGRLPSLLTLHIRHRPFCARALAIRGIGRVQPVRFKLGLCPPKPLL